MTPYRRYTVKECFVLWAIFRVGDQVQKLSNKVMHNQRQVMHVFKGL